MVKLLLLLSLLAYPEREMVVRVYVDNWQDLGKIEIRGLDVASGRPNQYYDLVVSSDEYGAVIASGLRSEVLVEDVEAEKVDYKGQYHSYDEVIQILRDAANTYPAICRLDSLGVTWEGRWIYCAKVSDEPWVEDATEPDVSFDGLHHAREWATVEIPLFYLDTLTSGYSSAPEIQDLVDNHEIWLTPVVNVDGYVYDYSGGGVWWRKNRQPFGGEIGTDPNRNYYGACNGDPYGDWGAIPQFAGVTHNPGSNVFCGPHAQWAYCVDVYGNFLRTHEVNANITYHSSGEMVLRPWGYTLNPPPDDAVYTQYAQEIASRIDKLGGGTYDWDVFLYPTSGATDDFAYGWTHYVAGYPCLSFTIEVGTWFYQNPADLDHICRENFDGALWLAQHSDSIRENMIAEVAAPTVSQMGTNNTGDYTVSWSPRKPDGNHPDMWQLDELSQYSFGVDDLESGSDLWGLSGFSWVTARSHSATHSLFSGSSLNMSNTATTAHPYIVEPGDSLSFWCWHDLELDYDVAVVEVSVDGKEWMQLDDRFTGSSGGWVRKSYALGPWEGKSIYMRFRAMCDDSVLAEGFYVDDIDPVPLFNSVQTLSAAIPDTFYDITGQPAGHYWYRARGHNSWGWGNFSILEDIEVLTGLEEVAEGPGAYRFWIAGNVGKRVGAGYLLPRRTPVKLALYDVSGRLVELLVDRPETAGAHRLEVGSGLGSGVYFLRFEAGDFGMTKKAVLLR